MKGIRVILTNLSLSVFICTSLAQQPSSSPSTLSFQNFTYEEGLSDNFISSIYQDSRGFLWISTPEGLNRYDGNGFKKIYSGKDQVNSFPSNSISAVYEYRKGHLLIATVNGLATMDLADHQVKRCMDPLLRRNFTGFLPEPNRIWLLSPDGLVEIDSLLNPKQHFGKGNNILNHVSSMHRLNDGRLLILSESVYYFFNEKDDTVTPLKDIVSGSEKIKGTLILSYFDKSTNCVFACLWEKGIRVIDFNQNIVRILPFNQDFRSCIRDSKARLWLGSSQGLSILDEKAMKLVPYSHSSEEHSSIVSNDISFLFEDASDNLWIGTTGGLSKLSRGARLTTVYRKELVLNGNKADIYDITKSGDRRIFIATHGNGIFSIDSDRLVRNYGINLIRFAWSINPQGENLIVTGHDSKIYRLYPRSGKTELINKLKPFQDSADLVLFAYTDHFGGRWYSVNKQMGLFYEPPNENKLLHFSSLNKIPEFPHSYFNFAVEDNQGRIWFGSNKRTQIVSYDFKQKTFKVHHISEEMGIPIAGANAIIADSNFIWLATDGSGLLRYCPDLPNNRLFTIEDGLSANNITSLVLDKSHRLWVGTRKGLDCLYPGNDHFIAFSRPDGLPETYFNDGALYFDSSANLLYAGAKETLIAFNPDEFLMSRNQENMLYIDDVLVNGKHINFSSLEKLSLPHDQNNLQFVFTTVNFSNPEGVRYYYRLDGADKDWNESGNNHSASYVNLSEGRYRFHVRASTPGVSSDLKSEIPFDIIISPPYWRTWWFRSLVTLAIISLIFALIRAYYLRKLTRQKLVFEKQQAIEQERTRIATDMHDDLGAGLTRIKFITESISENSNDPALEKETEKLRFSSNELIDKMGEIIWAMNDKNNTMEDLVFYLRSYAVDYCHENNLACDFTMPAHIPPIIVNGQIRRNIFLVLKECLHNVVKHAGATKVTINLATDHKLALSISDNGEGFKQEIETEGNGLLNMRKRAKELQGHITINNTIGTTVSIEIPL